jgi:hypothetical protein
MIRPGTDEFMRHFFPREYERRKKQGCCIHCGAKLPGRKNFKSSDTPPSGPDSTADTPDKAPHNHKEIA